VTYRLKASIDATRQVPGGEYTVRTPLSATGPGAALSTGVVGIPAGTLSGASFGVPLGDVASPELMLLQNGEQDLNVRLNGASSPLRVGPGGVLMINQESGGDEQQVSSVSVSTVAAQTSASSLVFVISGGPRAQTVDLSDVALWVIDNSGLGTVPGFACRVIGYSDSQYRTNYSGEPFVVLDFPGDIGHGIALSPSGHIVVAPGWNVNTEQQGLYTLPSNYKIPRRYQFGLSDVTRFNLDIYSPVTSGFEPRMAGFVSQDGAHWLTGTTSGFDYFNISALGNGVVTTQARIPNGGAFTDVSGIWDMDYDSAHNLWWVNDHIAGNAQGGVRMITRSRYESGEPTLLNFDVVFSGANFSRANGMAFDAVGGLHVSQWNPPRVAYYSPAQLASGSSSPTDPTPTSVLTWPAPLNDSTSVIIDAQGEMFRSDWTNRVVQRFTASQVAAGGVQVPASTITVPSSVRPAFIRLRSDLGMPGHIR
jgi:hypothetical protein